MSPSFAEIAPRYDALRPLSAGDRARLETMLREAALQPGDQVVEVGCGTGRLTLPVSAMTPARVTGVDAEVRMLDVARGKDAAGRVDWVRGSAYRLPLGEGTAALVMMVMVVHLLRQRVRAFTEARRILRPGGQLSLWTFTPRHVEEFYLNPYFPSIAIIDRARFPAAPVLSAELRRAGFDEPKIQLIDEPRKLDIADVVDRVRGRYISTLAMLAPLEYRLGLQQLEEMLARDRSIRLTQRSEWAIITARK
ncbi:MAG: methyltransferase domain-containing protein [Chloroflexi bacterium]|nr:MAG: methyltransferase domain-containing protein [Chloroflexota bacterium]